MGVSLGLYQVIPGSLYPTNIHPCLTKNSLCHPCVVNPGMTDSRIIFKSEPHVKEFMAGRRNILEKTLPFRKSGAGSQLEELAKIQELERESVTIENILEYGKMYSAQNELFERKDDVFKR